VTLEGAIALAIGKVFKNRWNRTLLRIGGQPDACGQVNAVAQQNQGVLDLCNLAGGIFPYHLAPSPRSVAAVYWAGMLSASVHSSAIVCDPSLQLDRTP